MQKLTYEDLKQAVSGTAAGIRSITRLEPLGGPADKLYPPTFGDAVRLPVPVGEVREERRKTKYALEWRRIAGTAKLCVVLDSVASQANRMEVALLDGYDRGEWISPTQNTMTRRSTSQRLVATVTSLLSKRPIALRMRCYETV